MTNPVQPEALPPTASVPRDEPAETAATQNTAPEPAHAPSLIETMRREPGGNIPLLELHLQRLRRSCEALGYAWPGGAAIRSRIAAASGNMDPARAWRLRLLLSPDGMTDVQHGPLEPTQQPVRVVMAGVRMSGADCWLRHKTTHRPWYEAAARWLGEHPDIFDVLYWTEDGAMCEGSRSNLYVQTPEGVWLTPPLQCGVLPGVQRQALLEAGLAREAAISREDFLSAPAWRISNGLRGWCDAVVVRP